MDRSLYLRREWYSLSELPLSPERCLFLDDCHQALLEVFFLFFYYTRIETNWFLFPLLPPLFLGFKLQNCSSHVRRAVVTCFSAGCCGRHGNRPVRYCKRCHVNHHSSEVGAAAETHLYQTSPPPINTRECGAEELVCTVEAVIRYMHGVTEHIVVTLWSTLQDKYKDNNAASVQIKKITKTNEKKWDFLLCSFSFALSHIWPSLCALSNPSLILCIPPAS